MLGRYGLGDVRDCLRAGTGRAAASALLWSVVVGYWRFDWSVGGLLIHRGERSGLFNTFAHTHGQALVPTLHNADLVRRADARGGRYLHGGTLLANWLAWNDHAQLG